MTDDEAELVAQAVLTLAVTVRDEGPAAVAQAAADVVRLADGDAVAALIAAAALIDVERPVHAWWQDPKPTAVEPHPDFVKRTLPPTRVGRRRTPRPAPVPPPPASTLPDIHRGGFDIDRPLASYYGPADPAVIEALIAELDRRPNTNRRTAA